LSTAPRDPAWSERERLEALRAYGVLDTPPEPAFDEIAEIAALVCRAPIAVVNLIDDTRQFFKAEIGLGVRETPVDVSICAHAILQRDLFVVPDTTRDSRFADNPLVTGEPNLRFYAGALLETPEGLPLGTVCVLDYAPRPEGLTNEQGRTLRSLARAVMAQLELRRSNVALARSERRFRTMTEHVAEALVLMDDEGRVTFANPAAERLFGWKADELLGEVLHDITHHHHPDGRPFPKDECPLVHALNTGEVLQDHEDVFFRKDGSAVPVICSNAPINVGDHTVGAVLAARDITERKRLEEQQALVSRELHHRVKNSLTTVQAVISSTARHAQTISEFRQAVTERITSLAKTHTVLIESQYSGAFLRDILMSELAPYDDQTGSRLKLEGPEVRLTSEAAVALGMAVHELTTNCAKYGAFSLPSGWVHVRWSVDDRGHEQRLALAWAEHDGPTVSPPERQGFGSVLLQRALGRQLGGDVEVTYAPEGLRVHITALLHA
jgi:PAS domain S-box-containing protein